MTSKDDRDQLYGGSLVSQAVSPLHGRYYRPENPSPLEKENWVCQSEHIIRVKGPVTVLSREVRTLVDFHLWYKYKGYWHFLPDQRAEFEKLGFYREVSSSELPWENGEKKWSDTPWARMSRAEIYAWIHGREDLTRRQAEESRETRSA